MANINMMTKTLLRPTLVTAVNFIISQIMVKLEADGKLFGECLCPSRHACSYTWMHSMKT